MRSLQVEITKDSLMNAVQHVIKTVPVNSLIPILEGIHIQARTDGLMFTASNTSMTIEVTIPQESRSVNVLRTGAVVAPARYVYEVIRKLNDEWVTLEVKENLILTVRSGHSQTRLCGMDSAEFPYIKDTVHHPVNRLRINNALLRSTIKQVAIVASTSESRPVLTGVSLGYDNDVLKLIATDGIRLASRTLHTEGHTVDTLNAIIPAKNLYEISKMLSDAGEIAEIEVSNDRVLFITNGLKVESVRIEGTYPSLKNVIPQSYLCEILVDRASLLKAFECVTVLAGESIIRLVVSANHLTLSSKTAEVGDTEYVTPLIHINGEEFTLSLNVKYLIDLLRSLDCANVQIRYAGKNSPIVILPYDSVMSTLFVITPVRTSD